MSGKAYNIIAAILCTGAAILTTIALLDTAPTDARILGIAAGISGTIGGLAWIVAAIKLITMLLQQYVLVALAMIVLITNALGLIFTIRRNRQHRITAETHPHQPLAKVW